MATTLDPKAYVLGAADVFYRAVGVTTPWTSIGATLDDAVLRITSEWFSPDNLNGILGPVMGLNYLRRQNAEIEFTMPEIAGSKLNLVLPGTRVTAAVNTTTGGGGSTTTTAASLVGATTLALTAATNFAVGDYFKIDTGTATEYRQITLLAALNISFRDPLIFAHAAGAAVVETDSDNKTQIESVIARRMADAEYREWALVMSNGSAYQEIRIPRGIAMTDSAEVTVGEQAVAGIRTTIRGNYTGTDLTLSPFRIYGPA
jgi:hypothetical protein